MPSYKVVLPRAPEQYNMLDQNTFRSEVERALSSTNVIAEHATQHEFGGYDELALAETQIVDGALLARVADAESISGLWSFSRSTNPPFAVNAGAALVTNLDADLLDGQQGSYYLDLDNILSNVIGTPTYTTAQEVFDLQSSPGKISGGEITDAGGATIDVAAGQGFIRSSDSGVAALYSIEWSAVSGQAIPADSTRWVLVEYNAGSPQVTLVSTLSGNEGEDAFILGTVVNEGGTLHIASVHENATSGAYNLNHMLREVLGITRADALGGLIINETGTRYVTVSAGEIYWGHDEFDYSAIDTSGADTFETYYQTAGTWTHATGVSQWDNDNYNDTTSGLVSMTNNRYANLWFYADIEGELVMVYGTDQYVTLGLAQAEQPPSVPARVSNHCLLLGRFIFQKGGATAEEIDSAFSTVLSTVGVTDHGNLAGLTDDDHTQYVLADGSRTMDTLVVGNATPGDDYAILQLLTSRSWQFETYGADGGGQQLGLRSTFDTKQFLILSEDGTPCATFTASNTDANNTVVFSGQLTVGDAADHLFTFPVDASAVFTGVTGMAADAAILRLDSDAVGDAVGLYLRHGTSDWFVGIDGDNEFAIAFETGDPVFTLASSGSMWQEVTGTTIMHRMLYAGGSVDVRQWDHRIQSDGDYELRSVTDAGTTVFTAMNIAHATGNIVFPGESINFGSTTSGGQRTLRLQSYTNNAIIYLHSGYDGAAEQSEIIYAHGSTNYWQHGKDTNHDFRIYDHIKGANVFKIVSNSTMTMTPTGTVTIAPSAGEILLNPANTLTIGSTDSRPLVFDPGGGSIKTSASVGGWAMSWGVIDSGSSAIAGFGFYGSGDTLTYLWIGPNYNDESVRIYDPGGGVASAVTVYIGQADTYYADLRLMGNTTGSPEGGRILLYTAADYDTDADYYKIQARYDNFQIFEETTAILTWDRSADEWEMAGDLNLTGWASVQAGTASDLSLRIGGSSAATGLYQVSANALGVSTYAAHAIAVFSDSNSATGRQMRSVVYSSAAYPFVCNQGQTGGLYFASNTRTGLSANGVDGIEVEYTTTAGETRLKVYDVDNGQLETVTVGAADSGGSGYKVLRIPN